MGHRSKSGYNQFGASASPWMQALITNGESLKPIQRAAVLIASLFIFAFGVLLFIDAIDAFRNGSGRTLLTGPIGMIFVSVGLLGFRNALRFRRYSPHPRS